MPAKTILFSFALLATLSAWPAQVLADLSAVNPDASLTPGVADPAVTQDNIHDTVCKSGYTSTVRNVTEAVKKAVYQRYNVTTRAPGEFEVDHLISLELGGANDVKNLWPQSYLKNPGAHQKDDVENALHRAICCDAMTLAAAQHAIVSDWLTYYTKLKDGSWMPCPTKDAKRPPTRSRVAGSKVLSEPTEKQVEQISADGPAAEKDGAKGTKQSTEE